MGLLVIAIANYVCGLSQLKKNFSSVILDSLSFWTSASILHRNDSNRLINDINSLGFPILSAAENELRMFL